MPVARKIIIGEAFSAVCEEVRDSDTGSAHPAFLRRFPTSTANEGTEKSRRRRGRAVDSGQRSQRSSFGGFDLFIGRAGWPRVVKFWR